MKVIQVVGYSGTGKTRFIEELIPLLLPHGEVGVIKHLGEHTFSLEEGKDTTLFYEREGTISAGIDAEKTVIIVRENRLDHTLRMFSDAGVQFCIVEGFKSIRFPRIVIGDLETEECVLRNPSPEEVMGALSRFSEYHTMGGVVQELKKAHDTSRAGAILTFSGIVREWTEGERIEYLDFNADLSEKIVVLKNNMEKIPGILGVRFYHQKGRLRAGEDITYIAVLAEHRKEALVAMSEALDELKRGAHHGRIDR
ncbi:MAG: molybdopterin-guanine dinucleotide biosynthesis protein B [Methanomicrobiales archaeon]|nr:molybdopterin-guanine dinucleotide biosynthesis protein B [Methanomicrobiales archaeon]